MKCLMRIIDVGLIVMLGSIGLMMRFFIPDTMKADKNFVAYVFILTAIRLMMNLISGLSPERRE